MNQLARTESEQSRRKTFAFLTVDAHGHINAMLAIADQLRARGHRTVFILNDGRVPAHYGHQVISVARKQATEVEPGERSTSAGGAQWGEEGVFLGDKVLNSKWERMVDLLDLDVTKEEFRVKSLTHNLSLLKLTIELEIIAHDSRVEEILVELKPDLALVDQLSPFPAVRRLTRQEYARKLGLERPLQWTTVVSCNPLPVYHAHFAGQLPPPFMGLPMSLGRNELEVEQLRYERALRDSGILATYLKLAQMSGELAQRAEAMNLEEERKFRLFVANESPHFNIYQFPRQLDYAPNFNLPEHWLRVDSLMRAPLAPELAKRDERLLQQVAAWRLQAPSATIIYASLGTTMGCNLKLVGNLLGQLFRCLELEAGWRFVVALGSRSHQIAEGQQAELQRWRLAGRVLSAGWWPQPELFKRGLLDACISHGGNNTIAELFLAARLRGRANPPRLLLVPAFHDQLDNARRVADLGLGVSLPASELLAAGERDLLLLLALRRALQPNGAAAATGGSCFGAERAAELRDSHYCARLIETKLAQLAG